MTYFLTVKRFIDVHGRTHGTHEEIEADTPDELAAKFGDWLKANPDVRPMREIVLSAR